MVSLTLNFFCKSSQTEVIKPFKWDLSSHYCFVFQLIFPVVWKLFYMSGFCDLSKVFLNAVIISKCSFCLQILSVETRVMIWFYLLRYMAGSYVWKPNLTYCLTAHLTRTASLISHCCLCQPTKSPTFVHPNSAKKLSLAAFCCNSQI